LKIDSAILKLGESVLGYRLAGRPDSPGSVSFWERGAGLLKSSSALASALVDFHRAVILAICEKY